MNLKHQDSGTKIDAGDGVHLSRGFAADDTYLNFRLPKGAFSVQNISRSPIRSALPQAVQVTLDHSVVLQPTVSERGFSYA